MKAAAPAALPNAESCAESPWSRVDDCIEVSANCQWGAWGEKVEAPKQVRRMAPCRMELWKVRGSEVSTAWCEVKARTKAIPRTILED